MPLVIGDAELLFDDLGDAGASPDLATEAVCFGAVPQEVGDEAQLIRFELGGGAGMLSREQSGRTLTASLRDPMADSTRCDAESAGYKSLDGGGAT